MTTITLTSKGQITLPVAARKALGLKASDKLTVEYDAARQTVTLKRPMTLDEITAQARTHLKPGIEPVLDVDKYYQEHRGENIL